MIFFDNKLMQACCWTLVHSLWQGLLLSLIAGMVIMSTKRSAVVLRYNLLTGLLIGFILTSSGTFFYEISRLHSTAADVLSTGRSFAIISNETAPQIINITPSPSGPLDLTISFLNDYSTTIVLLWMSIILLKCFRLVAGIRGMYLLKRVQTGNPGEYWTNRIRELGAALGIRKPVRLLQSALAKVPMVAGHLKPVILLPAGLLTSLPAEEVEAILLHELAHIRRRDYLVNMLQSICEILYFFNPAVLWLSALVKDERENCCDDIAIGQMKNKKQFIHALIAFQEYNMNAEKIALAFPGSRHRLLNRVNRILTNTNKTLNTMEKSFLASGLLLTSFFVLAFTQNNKKTVGGKEPVAVVKNSPAIVNDRGQQLRDTIPAKEKETTFTVNTKFEGKEYKFTLKGDKVTSLSIDDKKIPDDKIDDYKSITDKIIAEVNEQSKKARADLEEAKKQAELSSEQLKMAHEEMAKAMENLKEVQLKAEKDQLRAERSKKPELLREKSLLQADKQLLEAEQQLYESKALLQYKEQLENTRLLESQKWEYDAKEKALMDEKNSLALLHNAKLLKEHQYLLEEKHLRLAHWEKLKAEAWYSTINPRVEGIVEDLVEAGIIKDMKADISFKLDADRFIVNGTKQPEEIQKKFSGKYTRNKGDYINYSKDAHSTHSDIHIENKEE